MGPPAGGEAAPVEVVLVTGLPGSGRSALVASLLWSLPEGARCAVCVHRHAMAFGLETTDLALGGTACVHYSEVFDFGSGCLCCSPSGDLARLLTELETSRGETRLTHLIVETTGVADPSPFIQLLGQRRPCFELVAVACVLDLIRGPRLLRVAAKARPNEIGGRGAAQLQAADVVLLNGLDELEERLGQRSQEVQAEVDAARELALSPAGPRAEECEGHPLERATLGPTSYCGVAYGDLRAAARQGSSARQRSCAACAEPAPPSLFGMASLAISFGPGAVGHDASCDTACLVLQPGGVRLDAALALLQLLLDCGDALRVQGYLSFLPAALEAAAAANFPPPVERVWALPMLTVEGVHRGRLQVRAVEAAAPPGTAARLADESGAPWHESAWQSGAEDRGGCKVFVCGRGLDERALRAQLAQTAAVGFGAPVCDLTRLSEAATSAFARSEEAVSAAVSAGLVATEGPQAPGPRGLATERKAAEAFARGYAERLLAALPAPGAAPAPPLEAAVRLPGGRGRPGGQGSLRWAEGAVSVRRTAAVPAPLAGPGGGLRLCVDNAGTRAGAQLEVLVVGSAVYCRERA